MIYSAITKNTSKVDDFPLSDKESCKATELLSKRFPCNAIS